MEIYSLQKLQKIKLYSKNEVVRKALKRTFSKSILKNRCRRKVYRKPA